VVIEILTPEKTVFEGEVRSIKVPGKMGEFQVLKDHAPLVSTLGRGIITLADNEGTLTLLEIEGGIVEVKKNKIILLVEGVKG